MIELMAFMIPSTIAISINFQSNPRYRAITAAAHTPINMAICTPESNKIMLAKDAESFLDKYACYA